MANPTRLRTWSHEFRNSIVLMQGTQRQYDPSKGERTLSQWQTEYHGVIEAEVRKKNQGGPQPEGIFIMAPKGMFKISRKVLVPTNMELEGRGLMIWFSRGLYDLTLTTIYCPLGDRDVQNHRKTERLWQWVGRSRTLVPGRTRHIMGVDANSRVGSVRHYTTEDPLRDSGNRDDTEYPHIGAANADQENVNGTLMREFLEAHGMEAFNTHEQ